jgi:helicase
MRELANIFNKEAYPPLTALMTRVQYGVRRELLDLVKLRGVGRARARSMHDHGLRTLDEVRSVELSRLAHVPKIGEQLAKSIKEQVGGTRSAKEGAAERRKEEPAPEERKERGQKKLFDF